MLKELVKIANDLDLKGLTIEADKLDSIIKKIAQEEPEDPTPHSPEVIKQWREDGRFETIEEYLENEQMLLDSLNETLARQDEPSPLIRDKDTPYGDDLSEFYSTTR